jgi:hypothetical protein
MTAAQSAAARKNIKKAAAVAKKKKYGCASTQGDTYCTGQGRSKSGEEKASRAPEMMDQKHRNRFPSLVRSPRYDIEIER